MDSYLLLRKTEKVTSDALFFIRMDNPHVTLPGGGQTVDGRWIYNMTGVNAVRWRSSVSCEYMDEAKASAFTEIGGIDVHPLKYTELDVGFDVMSISPNEFDCRQTFNSFGSHEREIVGYWLIKWAQHLGRWDAEWAYSELNEWYNDTGTWKDRHKFRFNYMDQETWYSTRGEFRERPGHMVLSLDEGETYKFTPVFVQRCLDYVGRPAYGS